MTNRDRIEQELAAMSDRDLLDRIAGTFGENAMGGNGGGTA